MINPEKVYKYRVERVKHGKWIPLMQTDIEDADTFGLIANTDEYQYRIFCDSKDITHIYKELKINGEDDCRASNN